MSGHRMAITAVLFHPIYNLLFTGSEDCTIRVWDYENGGYERSIKGHTKPIHQLAVSNEKGSLLASCSSDLSIKIWDINNDYQCIKTLMGHDHSVSSIKFSPNNDLLLSASRDKSIKVWEVSTGYCLKTINGNSEWIRSIDISLDCSTIVAGSFDHMVRTYDFNSGELKNILKAHNNVVEYVNFLPIQSYPFIKDLCDLNTIPDVPGQFIISCSRDKTLALYNIQGQVLYQFKGHDNWVKQMVVTGGGKYMLSISDDKTLKAWDLQTGRVLRTILLDEQFPTSIAMSKDGLYCATTFPDGKISIWNCFK
ncbi:platelet-activating factor acetylhydrolase IB subunit alpha [Neoconidiobolus thromboides FSU 785]|nr:platelet-activating factor acetylhydrolase IB subunit alpha [Neoconidiobolus thromboides FSU 785]